MEENTTILTTNTKHLLLWGLFIFTTILCILECIAQDVLVVTPSTKNAVLNFLGREIEISTNAEKHTTKETSGVCLDGLVYNNPDAPIYKGIHAKDAKKFRNYYYPYLKKKGYEQYTDILVSMCLQESTFGKGDNSNWMQVLGYRGKGGIESARAGIHHFIRMIEEYCQEEDCTDVAILVQCYNFGPAYVDYCMDRGGKETKELRRSFQATHNGDGTFDYVDDVMSRVKGTKPS